MGLNTSESKVYLSVLGSDGSIRQVVDEHTEGAVRREYETSDGKTGEKWELKFSSFNGIIKSISFREGDYGTQILIDLEDDEDNEYVLALPTASSFAEHFMMKLPNIDLNEEVLLKPYSFPKEKGSDLRVKGMSIMQDDEKVADYFTEVKEGKDGKNTYKTLHGMPEPDKKKKYNSEKWRIFFAQRREWLMDYLVENDLVKATDPSDVPAENNTDDEDF